MPQLILKDMGYIYLDNAATTPLDSRVESKMQPYYSEIYGNAHSQHGAGRQAAYAVDCARDTAAEILGCKAEELFFTGSGTEANNWAVKGVCAANYGKKSRIIVSAIEHPSVIEATKAMEVFGFKTVLVNPDSSGIVRAQFIENALAEGDAAIVCVMAVNNETGVIQPVDEIYSVCKQAGVHFHCDCVQAAGALPVTLNMADSISLSAHKFYGPKGVGALAVKKLTPIYPLINGGSQEGGKRGGTTNVAGVVGFANALQIAAENREEAKAHYTMLRDRILSGLTQPFIHLNGSLQNRVPSNLNLRFDGFVNTQLMAYLDRCGICVSAGSACTAGTTVPSHVLMAMGLSEEQARSSIRITLGRATTLADADALIHALTDAFTALKK